MTTFTTEDRIHAYSHYVLLDEHGQAMRTVKTKHEAETLNQNLHRLVVQIC